MKENIFKGLVNRVFQHLARFLPGARSVRVALHRARGVQIGPNVWIGYDVVLETSRPHLVIIEEGVTLNMRVSIVAHFRETAGVKIERNAFIGPGVIILPNVVIGEGAVVTAGSVVTRSVVPFTMVQGNPAVPVARCGIPLGQNTTVKEFTAQLKPPAMRKPAPKPSASAPAKDKA